MFTRGSVALLPRTKAGLVVLFTALFVLSIGLQFVAASVPRSALAAEVVPDPTPNGCNGVLPTPGSENTNKRLVEGDLTPGGFATYEISFPVDAEDVGGDFEITDCVFIDDVAALKFFVHFVPNNENFILTFTLDIPEGTPLGAEFCNYAKTTASPSESQASNRKAGPACFIVGGNITIHKVNEAGDPLPGAKFHIECDFPTTNAFLPDTIINPGNQTFDSTSGGHIETDVTTGADGLIAIQAPEGTECTITETDPPDGYDLPDDPDVTLTATRTGVEHTFVDPPEFVPAPAMTISKGVSESASGPFVANLTTTAGTTVHYRVIVTNTGNIELTGITLADNLFQAGVDACDVPDTLAVGDSFTCEYTDTAEVGVTTNIATADSEETDEVQDSAQVTVEEAPSLTIVKSVGLSAEGPFGNQVAVETGTTVYYEVVVTNTGNIPLTGIDLSDNTYDIPADCVPDTLAVGDSFTCAYSAVAETGTTVNVATVDTEETEPEDDDATVVASPAPILIVEKTNDAPPAIPGADEGDTVHFKLAYDIANGPVEDGVIEDVLPDGLTYVANSATSNDEFTFVGYDSATRTLRWEADEVTEDGSVEYDATIDTGAAENAQPLTNTACISSADTEEDCAESDVFVAPPPQAETAPPTDIDGAAVPGAPGGSMLLVLMALAGIALAVVFVAPTPASIRRRQDR